MAIQVLLKTMAKYSLAPMLYRSPPSTLQPERLYLYLHTLIQSQTIPGDVVEVGCNLAGTSIIAGKMLQRLGSKKRYVCYDTFGGFTDSDFHRDTKSGTPRRDRYMFSANSMRLVERILRIHKAEFIELVQGDVARVPDEVFPQTISACLIDVDLSEPTYAALLRVYPRLSEGGVILVDDCPPGTSWKARLGYERFMSEIGLQERYEYGMGVVVKSSQTS
jgi:O-methyltransferase